jgi:hypothetical protein
MKSMLILIWVNLKRLRCVVLFHFNQQLLWVISMLHAMDYNLLDNNIMHLAPWHNVLVTIQPIYRGCVFCNLWIWNLHSVLKFYHDLYYYSCTVIIWIILVDNIVIIVAAATLLFVFLFFQ